MLNRLQHALFRSKIEKVDFNGKKFYLSVKGKEVMCNKGGLLTTLIINNGSEDNEAMFLDENVTYM